MEAIEKLRDLDHGLSDSQRLKIADLIEEQRERLVQFANAFDAGYAAAEHALAERAGEMKGVDGLSHELWAAAQLSPMEGITDGVARIVEILTTEPADISQEAIDLLKAIVTDPYIERLGSFRLRAQRIIAKAERAAPEGRQEAAL